MYDGGCDDLLTTPLISYKFYIMITDHIIVLRLTATSNNSSKYTHIILKFFVRVGGVLYWWVGTGYCTF